MSRDFVACPDAAFETFFRNITDFVLDNATRWGHIKRPDVNELENQFDLWNNAYEKTLVPHIPQLTQEKNCVRVTTERALRAFINRFLRFPPVTDLERDKMGIPNHDTIRTSSPVPTTVPEIEANSSVIRQLSLRMRDHGSTHWGKPDHVRSMELAWGKG